MGSERTKVDNTNWGKNGEGWFWVLSVVAIGCQIVGIFFDASALSVPGYCVAGIVVMALLRFESLKKEIADLKSGDADVPAATHDSE